MKVRTKPEEYEAFLLTPENRDAICKWCKGNPTEDGLTYYWCDTKMDVKYGEWIVNYHGFTDYTHQQMFQQFEVLHEGT